MTELSFQQEGGLGLSAPAAPAIEQPFKSTAGGAAAPIETPRVIQDAMGKLSGAEMITPENLGGAAERFPTTADLKAGAGGRFADKLQEVLDRTIGGVDSPDILAKIGNLEETIAEMARNQLEPAAGASLAETPQAEAPPAAEGSLAEGFTPLPADAGLREVSSRAEPPETEAPLSGSGREPPAEGAENRRTAEAGKEPALEGAKGKAETRDDEPPAEGAENRRTAEAGEEPTAEGTKGKVEAGGEEPPADGTKGKAESEREEQAPGENEKNKQAEDLPKGDGSPTHREVAAMQEEIATITRQLIKGETTPEQATERLVGLAKRRDEFVKRLAAEYTVGDDEKMSSYEKEVARLCSECVSLFEQVREASQILEELKNQKPVMNEQMRRLKDEQREATNAFKAFQESDMGKENRGALYMGKLEADQKVARQAANMARHELRMRQMTTIAKDNFRKFQALNSRLERLTGSRGFFEDLAVQIMHRIENWARETIQDEQISILARHIARKGSF